MTVANTHFHTYLNEIVLLSIESMCFALTKTNADQARSADKETQLRALFDPLIKDDMRTSWERHWKTWFVTTNAIADLREPGKLKGQG